MGHFTSGGARWRPKLGALLMALVGLSTLSVPSWSEATNDPCGRVYLVNADNELLRLRRSAQILALEGAFERDRNRRLDIRTRKPITGLADGEFLVGVDFRPSNGLLYGVGRIGGDPMALGQLYTIDIDSGVATAVGVRAIPLNGNAFGVDFNPVPDLLRIVSDLARTSASARPTAPSPAPTRASRMRRWATRTRRGRRASWPSPTRTPTPTSRRIPCSTTWTSTGRPTPIPAASATCSRSRFRPTEASSTRWAASASTPTTSPRSTSVPTTRPWPPSCRSGARLSRLYFIDLASGDATDLGQIGRGEQIVGLAIQVGPVCAIPSNPGQCPGSGRASARPPRLRHAASARGGEPRWIARRGPSCSAPRPRRQARLTETIRESPGSSMVTP